MEISRGSLVIAVTLSLLILCSGCATQHGPAAIIPAGPSVAHSNGTNTIPAGPSVVPSGTKHFVGVQ
jgi:hypothetical protein